MSSSGQQLTLDRLLRLIPPPAPTAGLSYGRLEVASYVIGYFDPLNPLAPSLVTQEAQAQAMEAALFIGAACTPPAVPTNLTPGATFSWAPPNADPRYSLWAGYTGTYPSPPSDPLPSAVTPPSILGTGTSPVSGAAGPNLDLWGSVLGNARWHGETDTSYALRILTDICSPSTTNYHLGILIDAAYGIPPDCATGNTQVIDSYNLVAGERFNDTFAKANRVGNTNYQSVVVPRANAAPLGVQILVAGQFVVEIPRASLPPGAPPPTAPEVGALVARRKAAGTECTSVTLV